VPALVDYEDVIAPSGATFVSKPGSEWTGGFLLAALRGEQLRLVSLDGNTVKGDELLFEGRFGRLRTVVEGPDGAIYALTNNTDGRGSPREGDDRVLRIVPPAARGSR
jgi:glucose/arabinose dehydrogenase